MNIQTNIRTLAESDYNEFISMSTSFYNMPCCDHAIPTSHIENTFFHCLKCSTYYTVLILEHNSIIAGYCALAFSYSTEAGGNTVCIDELFIKDEFQGLGLGHELFEYLYSNCPAKRYRLEVTKSNTRAIKLYKKLGFELLDYIQFTKDSDE